MNDLTAGVENLYTAAAAAATAKKAKAAAAKPKTPVAVKAKPKPSPTAKKAEAKPVVVPAKKAEAKSDKTPADQATKEIRWTSNKIALLQAMKNLGAISATTARNSADISKASKGAIEVKQVEHQVKAAFDLSMQKIVVRVDREDTGRSYFLSAKGLRAFTTATAK